MLLGEREAQIGNSGLSRISVLSIHEGQFVAGAAEEEFSRTKRDR